MKGHFRLADQHGAWGYFGAVSIDVEIRSGGGLQVTFDCDELQWRAGVAFGLAHAYEKAVRGRSEAVVRVTEVRGHDVDTTETLMAYVAANAFFNAMKVDPPAALALDRSAGVFTFPK
jgi:hypothetical protein